MLKSLSLNQAVYQLIQHLQPKKVPVVRMKQGSYDEDSKLTVRRFAFATQLLIWMGKLPSPPTNKDGSTPAWFTGGAFDPAKLADCAFNIEDVAF